MFCPTFRQLLLDTVGLGTSEDLMGLSHPFGWGFDTYPAFLLVNLTFIHFHVH
jgi:hypothetical protein